MNLNTSAVVTFLAGVILMYSAIKNKYPMDVIREVMGRAAVSGPISGDTGTIPPMDRDRGDSGGSSGQAGGRSGRSLPKGTPNTTV